MSYKLHHLGVVVANIEEAARLYSDILGVTPRQIIKHSKAGLLETQIPFEDNDFIEMLQPIETEDGSENDHPAARCLRARGEGLFHISVFVDDYDERVSLLREKGYTVEEMEVKEARPGYTIRLAWLEPKETRGVWIELVDEKSELEPQKR